MTDSKQHLKSPSLEQQDLLRKLAEERGVSFAYPQTSREASQQIKSLLALKPTGRAERRGEIRAVRDAMGRPGDAAVVRRDELGGHGSTARWR